MKTGIPLWIFNPLMLWGAGLGFIIGLSVVNLVDVGRHQGPFVAVYHDDKSGADHAEKVPESQYKRREYGQNGMMLVLGVLFWVQVAKSAKKGSANPFRNTDAQ